MDMHHNKNMTGDSIHRFLTTHEFDISTASISRTLTSQHKSFHPEKETIVFTGLQSTSYL